MRRNSRTTRRPVTAVLALCAAGMAVVTGCTSGGAAKADHRPSPSVTTNSATGTPEPGSPTTGSATPTTSTASAAPPHATTKPSSPAPATSTAAGCRSLTVSPAVKAEVTAAYGRQSRPQLVHIRPRTSTFFYGDCDGTTYAAAMFVPTAGATEAEQVAGQDEGAAMKYFTRAGNGSWTLIASDGLPRDPRGCAAIRQIPPRLATLWAGCRAIP
ncbi:hypothetical protein [Streptomyces sp. NPDC001068]|uniref:hypothetical protein n=1 Tax=Streptomyces sp. NPDC001068 TaxID=3364544 RepID=UPI0036745530